MNGYPDAGGADCNRIMIGAGHFEAFDGHTNVFGHAFGFADPGHGEEHHEFLTSETRGKAAMSFGSDPQLLGYGAQAVVARLVAPIVVERLEMVDVYHQQRGAPAVAGRFITVMALEYFACVAPVGKAGQRILGR